MEGGGRGMVRWRGGLVEREGCREGEMDGKGLVSREGWMDGWKEGGMEGGRGRGGV